MPGLFRRLHGIQQNGGPLPHGARKSLLTHLWASNMRQIIQDKKRSGLAFNDSSVSLAIFIKYEMHSMCLDVLFPKAMELNGAEILLKVSPLS